MKDAKALTLTYLTPVSLASLNGSDKEADNISSIKKVSVGTDQFPYVSAQAVRRALKSQLQTMGHKIAALEEAGIVVYNDKTPAHTVGDPIKYMDEDLFGFMNAKERKQRTGPVRVSPLIAMVPYQGDLDFGTNYMGFMKDKEPSIMETEIHAGLYRGTILIEMDRIGSGKGFDKETSKAEKAKRVKDLLSSVKNLWTPGRQGRYLADISPKFVAAAMLRVKNPIFLESVQVDAKTLNMGMLNETVQDYKGEIIDHVFGLRQGFFSAAPEGTKTIGEAFDAMTTWVDKYYA